MVSFNFLCIIKPKLLPSNSLMTHFVSLRVDFECEYFKILSISSLLTLAKRLCRSYSSTSLANIKSKSSFHQSEILQQMLTIE